MESRVFEARVVSFGELVGALYEYERATYNRVKARIERKPRRGREPLRQDAWSSNARVRAAIGVVALLSARHELHPKFDVIRERIGDLNQVRTLKQLKDSHEAVYDALDTVLSLAKADLEH